MFLMICSHCGGPTKVVATRSVAKPGKGSEVNKVANVVEWYTSDFIARRRQCKVCKRFSLTVELLVEDVSSMVDEAAKGHAPKEGM